MKIYNFNNEFFHIYGINTYRLIFTDLSQEIPGFSLRVIKTG